LFFVRINKEVYELEKKIGKKSECYQLTVWKHNVKVGVRSHLAQDLEAVDVLI
jgi:hypothetical protein